MLTRRCVCVSDLADILKVNETKVRNWVHRELSAIFMGGANAGSLEGSGSFFRNQALHRSGWGDAESDKDRSG